MSMKINIDGIEYEAEEGQTILDVVRQNGIEIPTLCSNQVLENVGACRLCVVEVEMGSRKVLKTSCTYPVSDGLKVVTNNERVNRSRKMTAELLLARCPEEEVTKELAARFGITTPRFKPYDDNCILCGLCVRMCKKIGRNAINFQNRGFERELGTPFMEATDDCISCGACNFICPTSRFSLQKVARNSGNEPIVQGSEYEEGLKQVGNVSIYFAQSVPNTPVINRENCVHFQLDGCGICEEVCPPGAIDYSQEDKIEEVEVGSIILSPGFDEFEASRKKEYGHGIYPNVVTSIEYERILSASGPFGGHVQRISDGRKPKKIAFLQCVGSRDEQVGNDYCSGVCCMYAMKEAVITKEHEHGVEPAIFYIDIRAYGKEFDDYYTRAEKQYGVRFVRSRIAGIEEDPETNDLTLRYVVGGEPMEERFDMVVLSVGMEATRSHLKIRDTFGIDLNRWNFAKTDLFRPVETTRPGVYVSGVFAGPKDIPDTVAQASAAAAHASADIHEARNTLVMPKEYPPERDVTGEEPRIGVFVCHCGINIGGYLDVPSVAEYARTLPGVVFSTDNLYTCSQDTQVQIREKIEEHKLNRVIVASCTPRTHEPLFQETIREGGLNRFLFEMANIRDQCSWIHMNDRVDASIKAKDLVRMAVAKSRLLEPLQATEIPVIQKGLVVGGGPAGLQASLDLAAQGFDTYLVERENEFGGHLRDQFFTLDGIDPQERLKGLIEGVVSNPLIHVFTGATIKDIEGYVGNFKTTLEVGGETREFEHGTVIITTGAEKYTPTEYLYGQDPRVMTHREFERKLKEESYPGKTTVFIQCCGSRVPERPYCSRTCCNETVKQALVLKERDPDAVVYVLYRDMRTYGLRETYYNQALEKGVKFINYDLEHMPVVENSGEGIEVRATDVNTLVSGIMIRPDAVVLANATIPHGDSEELAKMLKIPLSKDGWFLEAHMKLRPVEFATEGVFLAGHAHSPKNIDEIMSQASAAASRASVILSKDTLVGEGITAEVNENLCNGCGLCVPVCAYKAIEIEDVEGQPGKKIAVVNESLCKGCGACVGSCPSGAMEQKGFLSRQISAMIDALLDEEVT